jgi:hypothetical protein
MDMKGAIVVAALVSAVVLGACRKEVPYEPLKLGGPVPATEIAR